MEINDQLKKLVCFKCRASKYDESLNSKVQDILINKNSKMDEVLAFPNLKRVVIAISDPITSVDVENLFKLEKLESVQFSRCKLQLEEIPMSFKVKGLYLDGCECSGTLKIGNQSEIESFLTYRMAIDKLDLTGLAHLKRLTIANSFVKEVVGLDKNNLTDISEIILDGSKFENEPNLDFPENVTVSRNEQYMLYDRRPIQKPTDK